jgi:hypothetical protein
MMASFELNVNEEGPVDVEAVMRQIREYILARDPNKPAGERAPVLNFDGPLAPAIYEHLYHANVLRTHLTVAPLVVPSTVPIVGKWLTLVRGKLHELALFYVNQLAQKQGTINAHAVAVLNDLVREVENLKKS